jgi:hypothetical protein
MPAGTSSRQGRRQQARRSHGRRDAPGRLPCSSACGRHRSRGAASGRSDRATLRRLRAGGCTRGGTAAWRWGSRSTRARHTWKPTRARRSRGPIRARAGPWPTASPPQGRRRRAPRRRAATFSLAHQARPVASASWRRARAAPTRKAAVVTRSDTRMAAAPSSDRASRRRMPRTSSRGNASAASVRT